MKWISLLTSDQPFRVRILAEALIQNLGGDSGTIKAVMDQNEPPKIVFEGEEPQYPARSFQTPTPKIVGWVIKYSGGLVKDEKQANYVLIGFVAVVIIISLFMLFSGGSNSKPPVPSITGVPIEKTYQGEL